MTEQPSWFRETPESLALLAAERVKVEAAEALYEPDPAAVYGGDLAAPLCCCKRGSMCAACGSGEHWQCPDRDDQDDEARDDELEDWQDEDDE